MNVIMIIATVHMIISLCILIYKTPVDLTINIEYIYGCQLTYTTIVVKQKQEMIIQIDLYFTVLNVNSYRFSHAIGVNNNTCQIIYVQKILCHIYELSLAQDTYATKDPLNFIFNCAAEPDISRTRNHEVQSFYISRVFPDTLCKETSMIIVSVYSLYAKCMCVFL